MRKRDQEPGPDAIKAPSRGRIVQALKAEIARLERARQRGDEGTTISSGCEALDLLLPERGFRRGTLVEWLAAGVGTGRETLPLCTAREACREGGAMVVLDEIHEFYPPAAVRLGIGLDQVIVVAARNQADNTWALDQSLRCPAVAVVLAWPEKLNGHAFRRLQLAAEQGGGVGLLMRSLGVRHEPSWAEVRLLVEPLSSAAPEALRRLKIEVLRSPGRSSRKSVEVEINDEAHPVYPARRLAHRTNPRRAAGA